MTILQDLAKEVADLGHPPGAEWRALHAALADGRTTHTEISNWLKRHADCPVIAALVVSRRGHDGELLYRDIVFWTVRELDTDNPEIAELIVAHIISYFAILQTGRRQLDADREKTMLGTRWVPVIRMGNRLPW